MTQAFDAIVIGAGQAGSPLAVRLAAAGMTVALIERSRIGGTCVNTGCTPTKALVASAYAAHLARRAGDYGVAVGAVTVDARVAFDRANAIATHSRDSVTQWLASTKGVTVIRGHARFDGPAVDGVHAIRVGDDTLTAPRIFVNVGGRAAVPDLPGVHDVPFLTNTSLLAIESLPKHLIVVGGSYIGLEFAQIVRRLGADVTVVEKGSKLVSREDDDVADAVRGILEAEGIAVRTDATCIALRPHPDGVQVGVDCTSGEPSVTGSHVLLAVGRVPNTDDLGLDRAGIAVDARGNIVVDDHLKASVDGVWALGDCNGRGAFTHTSYNDYEIVAANLLDGEDRLVSSRVPAYALYIDPPLGRVGDSEHAARAAGRDIVVNTRPMTRVGRAIEKGETLGFMKVVVDAKTRAILGAAILGTGGDEAIHGLIDAMVAGEPAGFFRRAVPIHPTVSELIPTLLEGLHAPAP